MKLMFVNYIYLYFYTVICHLSLLTSQREVNWKQKLLHSIIQPTHFDIIHPTIALHR